MGINFINFDQFKKLSEEEQEKLWNKILKDRGINLEDFFDFGDDEDEEYLNSLEDDDDLEEDELEDEDDEEDVSYYSRFRRPCGGYRGCGRSYSSWRGYGSGSCGGGGC